MRLIFGLVSLLVMLAAVTLLAKKSLAPVQVLRPDVSKNAALPTTRPVTTGSVQPSQALQQVQQQLQQTMDEAARARLSSEEK